LHALSITKKEALEYAKWLAEGSYSGRRRDAVERGERLNPSSIRNHLKYAALFYDYLRDVRGLATTNPFRVANRTFTKQHRAHMHPDLRALDEVEVASILERAETLDDFTSVLALFKTGVRRDELVHMREERIDWEARTILLDAHPKRTFLKVYFDDELAWALRLQVDQNHRLHPGNPYLWPSRRDDHQPIRAEQLNTRVRTMAQASSAFQSVKDWRRGKDRVTAHTFRRAFTSILKTNGCPSHVVARLRGDSLTARSELILDPTQGIYTKFGKKGGVDELRHWYDKTMPTVGAREIWSRLAPEPLHTRDIAALIRSASPRAG